MITATAFYMKGVESETYSPRSEYRHDTGRLFFFLLKPMDESIRAIEEGW